MSTFTGVLSETVQQFIDWMEAAAPKLIAALLILLAGWIVARLVHGGLYRLFQVIKLDALAERAGIAKFLQRGDIRSGLADLLAKFVYWVLLLLTLLAGVNAMGIAEAQTVFASVVAIIPRVIVALVVFLLGLSFAGFVGDAVQTAAVNAKIQAARLLSNVTRYATIVFVVIVALNQLQIGVEVISQAFLILFGAICLALALAFGLGCRDLAGRIAQEAWERERARAQEMAKAAEAGAGGE
jgi:hypothetical protein